MTKPETSFNLITAEEAIEQAKEYTRKRSTGEIKSLLTPWKGFNKRGINGLEWGTINTIGGMSSAGKTAVASILETGLFDLNPKEDFACLNLCFEMKASKLIGRKLSSKLKISTTQLYSGDTIFNNFEDLNKNIPLDQHKGLVLFLDHSILVKKDSENSRLDALHGLCEMFNDLKKKYKGIFIILTQLNRSIEASERRDEDKNQILHFVTRSDIYGGESLFQFSDIVLIIHRPEILNITRYGPDGWVTKDKIFFHYIKTRESEPGITIMKNNLKNNEIIEE